MAGSEFRVGGALLSSRGDWAWMKQVFDLTGWKGEQADRKVCWLCGAGLNAVLNAYDVSMSAAWRNTMVTMASFWERSLQDAKYISPLLTAPGAVISMFKPDWMHVCDLGTLQYLHGNTVYDLWRSMGGKPSSPASACSQVMNMIKLVAKDLKTDPPFNSLSLGMFRKGRAKPVKLKLKAAEARHLVPVMLEILHRHFRTGDPYEELRYQCYLAIHRCYEEMNAWAPGGESTCRLGKYVRQHITLYIALQEHVGVPTRWHLVPKHHLLLHLGEQALTNPRDEWCYADESEVGICARISKTSNVQHFNVCNLKRYRETFAW